MLFITAHPDDEAMYVGGTLAKLRDAGVSTCLLVFSHGEGGRVLEKTSDGIMHERRDYPRSYVAQLRDGEMRNAATIAGAKLFYLYPSSANVDAEFNQDPEQSLQCWNKQVPGGVKEMRSRLRQMIRKLAPQVVVTMHVKDDPTGTRHGHHRAVGALVKSLAQKEQGLGVGEYWAFAPSRAHGDFELEVCVEQRLRLLKAHHSQFSDQALDGPGHRPTEAFVWLYPGSYQAQKSLFVAVLEKAKQDNCGN
ncbi:MAG: PIG-L family deacetylase [Myxococcales bacterium]|nr:MAG: PIG-L family deacetylase [Myxococcales bacterium]